MLLCLLLFIRDQMLRRIHYHRLHEIIVNTRARQKESCIYILLYYIILFTATQASSIIKIKYINLINITNVLQPFTFDVDGINYYYYYYIFFLYNLFILL